MNSDINKMNSYFIRTNFNKLIFQYFIDINKMNSYFIDINKISLYFISINRMN